VRQPTPGSGRARPFSVEVVEGSSFDTWQRRIGPASHRSSTAAVTTLWVRWAAPGTPRGSKYSRNVDIEEFYDGRRPPPAVRRDRVGRGLHDAKGVRYELNWIEDTGELLRHARAGPPEWADRSVASMSAIDDKATFDSMTVAVVATSTDATRWSRC